LGIEVARRERMKALSENMKKSSYEVEVLVNGKPAKEYSHDGKIFIEGREGTKFSLRFHNNTWSKKLFIPTIDGLSIIDGELASYKSSGYIVDGYGTVTIDGWRKNTNEVAEFYFSSPDRAYAHRVDKGGNLGVIGVAVFDEKIEPIPYYCGGSTTVINYTSPYLDNVKTATPLWNFIGGSQYSMGPYANSVNYCSLSNTPVSKSLGTGWGNTKKSNVTTIEFKAMSSPETIFEIFYNTREQLESMGIDFKKAPLYMAPQAFPAQYCKPPQD
jgi:hypothetical protein